MPLAEDTGDRLLLLADDVPSGGAVDDLSLRGVATGRNGDEVAFGLRFDAAGHVAAVAVEARGSVLCRAAAAALRNHVAGRSLDDLRRLTSEEALDLLGIPLAPSRMRCALLAFRALKTIVHTLDDAPAA